MTYKYNPFAAAYPSDRGPLGKIFKPVIEARTYLRGAHMMLMFPLGIAYFIFFVVTLSVGGSLIWTLAGPIVLVASLFISRWLGDLEAYTAGYVNGSDIRRPPFRLDGVSGFRSQVKVRLVDPTTWTGLIYLVAQFPLGIVAFVTLVAVYSTAGAMVVSPLGALLNGGSHLWDIGVQIELIGTWNIDLNEYPGSLLSIPFGLIGFVLASHLVVTYSSLHGWWARLMLGSRSTRVSSRPAPDPAGDEPPKPSTTVETVDVESSAIVTIESPTEIEKTPDEGVEQDSETDPQLESPLTAARVFADKATTSIDEPYLKPVLNPSEIVEGSDVQNRSPDLTPIAELTTREQEVFMLMAHGDTNADIAEELFISEGTVKTHVKRVLSKLYMRDRTQVVVFAYENLLVLPGSGVAAQTIENRSYGG